MKRLLELAEVDHGAWTSPKGPAVKYCLDNMGQPRSVYDVQTTRPPDSLWNELRYQEYVQQILNVEQQSQHLVDQQSVPMETETGRNEDDETKTDGQGKHVVSTAISQRSSLHEIDPEASSHPELHQQSQSSGSYQAIIDRMYAWRTEHTSEDDRSQIEEMKSSLVVVNGKEDINVDSILNDHEKASEEWSKHGIPLDTKPILYWDDSMPRVRNNESLRAAAWLAVQTKSVLVVISTCTHESGHLSRSMRTYQSCARATKNILGKYGVPLAVIGRRQTDNELHEVVFDFLTSLNPKAIFVNEKNPIRQCLQSKIANSKTPILLFARKLKISRENDVDKKVCASHFSSSIMLESLRDEIRSIPTMNGHQTLNLFDKALINAYRELRSLYQRSNIFDNLQRHCQLINEITVEGSSFVDLTNTFIKTKLNPFLSILDVDRVENCDFEGSELDCIRNVQKLRRRVLQADKATKSSGGASMFWLKEEMKGEGIAPLIRCSYSQVVEPCFSLRLLLDLHVDSTRTNFTTDGPPSSLKEYPSYYLWYRALLYLYVLPSCVLDVEAGSLGDVTTSISNMEKEKAFLKQLLEDRLDFTGSKAMSYLEQQGYLHPVLTADFVQHLCEREEQFSKELLARCLLVLRKYKYGPMSEWEVKYWKLTFQLGLPRPTSEYFPRCFESYSNLIKNVH